jgi:hypothetical protein
MLKPDIIFQELETGILQTKNYSNTYVAHYSWQRELQSRHLEMISVDLPSHLLQHLLSKELYFVNNNKSPCFFMRITLSLSDNFQMVLDSWSNWNLENCRDPEKIPCGKGENQQHCNTTHATHNLQLIDINFWNSTLKYLRFVGYSYLQATVKALLH